MVRRGNEIELNDFSGGLHSATAITETKLNEAYDLSNVVIGPAGKYVRTRYGNTVFNSASMNSGAPVQGLGYFKPISGSDHLVAVCGDKIYESTSLDGTMNDITGALTIANNQDNIWTLFTFNNIHLGFGGPATNPDTPFQYTGTGNAAALSGTPPSAYGAVQANNRVFAFRTSAAPSIVQWCVLGNPQDWTSAGSGSQNVSTKDNDSVTACAVMNDSVMLVFKENSIHKMLINTLVSSAFPVFPLFQNIGCAGKNARVVVDGLCYFITPFGDMKVTDGSSIATEAQLPRLFYTKDLWASMNSTRFKFVQGLYLVGPDYAHIGWLVTSTSSGTTNNWLVVWDIRNKCWLRHKSGWKHNVGVVTQTGAIYTGTYGGVIHKQDVSSVTTDASESSTNVDSYWSSGWLQFGSFQKLKTIQEAYLSFVSQTTGSLNFSWGYDFNLNQKTKIIDQRLSGGIIGQFIIGVGTIGGQSDTIKRFEPIGNGRVFQYRFRNNDSQMKINRLTLLGTKLGSEK